MLVLPRAKSTGALDVTMISSSRSRVSGPNFGFTCFGGGAVRLTSAFAPGAGAIAAADADAEPAATADGLAGGNAAGLGALPDGCGVVVGIAAGGNEASGGVAGGDPGGVPSAAAGGAAFGCGDAGGPLVVVGAAGSAPAGGVAGIEVAQEVLAETQSAVLPLVPYLDTLRWVFIAVALAGIAVTIYARLDDWKRGQR